MYFQNMLSVLNRRRNINLQLLLFCEFRRFIFFAKLGQFRFLFANSGVTIFVSFGWVLFVHGGLYFYVSFGWVYFFKFWSLSTVLLASGGFNFSKFWAD